MDLENVQYFTLFLLTWNNLTFLFENDVHI